MKTKHGILVLTQHPTQPGFAIINNDLTAGILCGMRCLDIIRAVNSHDSLLKACRDAIIEFEYHNWQNTSTCNLLKQAIAKATEGLKT